MSKAYSYGGDVQSKSKITGWSIYESIWYPSYSISKPIYIEVPCEDCRKLCRQQCKNNFNNIDYHNRGVDGKIRA